MKDPVLKTKWRIFGLILTSLIGYLEWGGGNHAFLGEIEFEVLSKLISDPVSAIHPFTILPLVGQIILMITLFQKEPNKRMSHIGIALIAFLFVFVLFIGLLSMNWKVMLSTLPFIILAVMHIRISRKRKL